MISPLPPGWTATRATLQRYAQALTAFPRASADPDPRWSHVAMDPVGPGFASKPVALADGTSLHSALDLVDHRIRIGADDDERIYDMALGPSPSSIGQAILQLAADHGSRIRVDAGRFEDTDEQVYDTSHAAAFFEVSSTVVDAMRQLNTTLQGEVAGPHLWPHGFDIATEWISEVTVGQGADEANAQIATGWFPSEDSYLYVNPWPFEEEWSRASLPHGAAWHLDGWQGAELSVPASGLQGGVVVELAQAVHVLASPSLRP